ncbi:UAA transporter family-domain-containing protein [Pavlovales sp. CCMP2436]|nr:UAA transporter family-domain-containing protein [Pavlovales sp. CCMP2436]
MPDAWRGRAGEVVSYALSFGSYYVFVRLALAYRWDLHPGVLGALARATVGTAKCNEDGSEGKSKGVHPPAPETFRAKGATLIFCIVGIQASYLCWGLMQERIMTRPYGVEEERFKSSKFLKFVNCLVALGVAAAVTAYNNSPPDSTPPFRYSFCSTSNILSSVCQYEALKYVSFPTQVLAKSCKMVPVMLMGYAVSHRSYPILDWAVALGVTAGVVAFKLNEESDKPERGGTDGVGLEKELLGYALIVGYMAFDSFTSNWQESLFKKYPSITPVQMMRQVNLFSATFTAIGLLLTSEAFTMPAFLARHPDCTLHIVLMSICSAIGQLFIFYTIKNFGALVFATINTVRTLFSVVLSFLVFGHAINVGEALGVASVFTALGIQVAVKWRRAMRPKPRVSVK